MKSFCRNFFENIEILCNLWKNMVAYRMCFECVCENFIRRMFVIV